MPESSKRPKGKLKWSNLYSFSCFRPSAADDASVHPRFGQPGFSRMVFCNESNWHKTKPYKYPDNYVSSTKYNILTFLPRALFEQFRRVANLYFLLAAVLSLCSLSPFSKVSQIAPLVFVVGISMIKEGVEDWHRFLQDLDVNSRPVKVHIGNGLFVNKKWRSLLVGDIVKVDENEYFPSDLLLLSSSYEDGVCYVETMNLDGETNLKVKRCLEATICLDKDAAFNDFQATIRCEDPNPDLYTFVGNLEFKNQSLSLSPSQVLLRDSKLRNTEYVYGVVIFSGSDTKAVRNSTKSPAKRSRIERKMDQVIYLLFSMLVLVSLATSFGFVVSLEYNMKDMWYLRLQKDKNFNPSKPLESSIRQFIRALLLYGYLIPISLYVSIELVKVLQAVLINKDIEMYDELTGKSVIARTSNLNEELGQVEVILSDKTGTLTCNQMEFRKCSIAGVSYGGDSTVIDRAASRRMNVDIETYEFSLDEAKSVEQSLEIFEFSVDINTQRAGLGDKKNDETPSINPQYSRILPSETKAAIKGFNFNDDRFNDKNWISRIKQSSEVVMFLRVMALCHTGIPVEDGQSNKLKYEAESPEEVSFLIAAQEFGFKFCHRTQSMLVVKEIEPSSGKEVERKYKLLNLLEFSSSRKRMSVIVRNEEGQIFLLCKGADSIIFDRLAESGQSHQAMTSSHLSKYAEDGFRTLVFAYRMLEKGEYENWNSIFTQAKATIGPEREELLEIASDMLEKDLNLLGAVAVEDRLQKGVPKCIDKLAQAGLKIWLLTGDKEETAINIGFSCSLLQHDMKQFHLSLSKEIESKGKTKDMIEDIFHQLEIYHTYQVTNKEKNKSFALVVDGKALEIALRKEVKDQFLQLAVSCASVICCRVSPKQKALIARSVKEYTGKTILAIGDGANDVGMIQEADIGVGISGVEGMQAVMASDFSLPQFRFLERLLIVHGHWCYKRISKMILYFVYKNIAFGLTLFYFEKYTSFGGDVLFDDWYMVLFNLLFTSMPVISLGVLDQDVSSDVCLKFPALYQQGQKDISFSWYRVIGWMINGVLASLAALLLNTYTLSPAAFRRNGNAADLAQIGAITYTCVIWTVNCQIALIISHFTWIQHLFIWGSIISWYIFMLVYGILPPNYSNRGFQVLKEIGPAPVYWFLTMLVLVVSLLPYFIHIVIQRIFYPMDDHLLLEIKYLRKDITDNPMWLREQQNSKKKTQIGFSSRVDAKIDQLKRRLWQKKAALQGSAANSPVYETVATNPVFSHQE